jgi:peptide/nickel transport system permease protein
LTLLRQAPGFALQLGLTFLGLLAVTFFIGRVVPIDPVLAVVGDQAPRDVYEQARRELGLDQPLWAQFAIYVRNVLSGDFGQSLVTNRPVIEDIARVFPATLELATFATIIGVGGGGGGGGAGM